MTLLKTRRIAANVGADILFEEAELAFEDGERVCVTGRNGAGKSTLISILAGLREPDAGMLEQRPELRIALVPQGLPVEFEGSALAIVTGADDAELQEDTPTEPAGEIASLGGGAAAAAPERWERQWRAERVLQQVGIDPAAPFRSLSGGYRRRLLLARALAAEPDLLLLDEPTNHLDLPAIEWLERTLESFRGALVFTTHDRAFLERLATRIVEIDMGRITSWPGDYRNFLRRREERWAAEEQEAERQGRRLAAEEAWLRRGLTARRTRNMGRLRRLKELREEHRGRRQRPDRASLALARPEALRSGRRMIEAEDISFDYAGAPIVRDFSCLIERGDRIGIVGPNGIGKTTLARLLLGELAPTQGRIRHGARVETAYFDQEHENLPEDVTVKDAVADGAEFLTVRGASVHVIGYLRDFLFSGQRAQDRVRALSGGERSRLLLARLFARPANLLVLDEPTNNLDLETLEVLEERLGEFPGTLMLVSHDRAFLDNLVTSIFVCEGDGRVSEHVGGYSDWLAWTRARQKAGNGAAAELDRATSRDEGDSAARSKGRRQRDGAPRRAVRLRYAEERELEALPERIEELETRLEALHAKLADPAFYRDTPDEVASVRQELEEAEAALESAFERWGELERKSGGGAGDDAGAN